MNENVSNATNPNEDAERESLLIEKLHLDNDEQRARIAQLQLKWWQKPIGLLAMILPLVPLMATGAAAIADKWSEQARNAAAAEQTLATARAKEAVVAKQEYALKNVELGIEQSELTFQNTVLRFEQKQLKNHQETLAARVQQLAASEKQLVDAFFKRYENVCSIGGKIVTANDYETAKAEYAKFDAFDVLAIDAKLADPIKEVGEQLKQWKQRPNKQLEDAVLQVSIACKNAFNKRRSEQFERPVRELTVAIYEEAESMVRTLEESTDFADAQATVDRFWELYYGKLVLVESPGVESAMVRSGQALKAWTEGPPNKVVLKRLSDVFRDEYKTLMQSLQEEDAESGRPVL